MYHFIVNPNSRSGYGGQIWKIVEEELNRREIDYNVYFTNHRYHATEIARSLTFDINKQCIIVVLGGDGTINEVINGIINYNNVILGYIPSGSSNDMARGLKLPTDPLKALENILNPKHYATMDLGLATFGKNNRTFAVSSGIGYDAAVCLEALDSPLKTKLNKIKLGKLTYLAIALKQLIQMKPVPATLVLDDVNKIKFDKIYFMAALNLPYEGGGFKFCPKAKTNDGLIDLIVVDSIPKLKVLFLLPLAFKGLHTHFKGINIYQAQKAEITIKQRLAVHTDGESGFMQQKLYVECSPNKLKIIA